MEDNKDILRFINPKKQDIPDEGYFNELARNLIADRSKSVKRVIPLYKRPAFKWFAAAAVILPIVLFVTIKSNNQKSSSEILLGLNEIPKSEIKAYILNNIEEFKEEDIIEFVDIKTIDNFRASAVSLKTSDNDKLFNSISKDDIRIYFDEEEIDLEELEDDELFI